VRLWGHTECHGTSRPACSRFGVTSFPRTACDIESREAVRARFAWSVDVVLPMVVTQLGTSRVSGAELCDPRECGRNTARTGQWRGRADELRASRRAGNHPFIQGSDSARSGSPNGRYLVAVGGAESSEISNAYPLRISMDGAGIAAYCLLRGHRMPGPKIPIVDPAHVVLPRSSGDPRVAHDVQRPRRSAAPVHSCSITSDAARTAVRSPTPCPASIWI